MAGSIEGRAPFGGRGAASETEMDDRELGAEVLPAAKARARAAVGGMKAIDGGVGGETVADARPVKKPGAVARKLSRAEAVKPSMRRKTRAMARPGVRWSAEREAVFLATLSQVGNVLGAARAAGLSSASVYRRRGTCETFRAAWAAALREGYVQLETMLLGRALNGVRKPVWHGGKKVGSILEYSDRTALALLAHHRASVVGEPARAAPMSDEEAAALLTERLGQINRRLGGEG